MPFQSPELSLYLSQSPVRNHADGQRQPIRKDAEQKRGEKGHVSGETGFDEDEDQRRFHHSRRAGHQGEQSQHQRNGVAENQQDRIGMITENQKRKIKSQDVADVEQKGVKQRPGNLSLVLFQENQILVEIGEKLLEKMRPQRNPAAEKRGYLVETTGKNLQGADQILAFFPEKEE